MKKQKMKTKLKIKKTRKMEILEHRTVQPIIQCQLKQINKKMWESIKHRMTKKKHLRIQKHRKH